MPALMMLVALYICPLLKYFFYVVQYSKTKQRPESILKARQKHSNHRDFCSDPVNNELQEIIYTEMLLFIIHYYTNVALCTIPNTKYRNYYCL